MSRSISHSQTALRSLTQTLISLSISCSNRLSAPFSSSSRHDDEDEWMVYNRDPESPPRLFVVQPRLRPEARMKSKLSEALNLANSLEEQRDGFYGEEFSEKELPPHLVVQNPVVRSGKSRSDTYFGPGTVDNIKCHINAIESQDGLDAVFVNAVLSGIQQRNLERAWGKPVLDRVGLIIEIFNAHAQTKEAKLQSELAALMYKRTRLVRVRGSDGRLTFGASGEAEVVSARGRGGSGGRGFTSGAGETELQLQRRRILERRSHLRSLIEEVRRTRAVQRASRRRRGGSDGQGLSTVAVVGYTNAGKSTLVNALSDSNVYCDDRLFATVDPRLRNVVLPSGKKVLLSDTVGFISDLPVQLVEAFHATLEEVVEADLLVHVLDSSAVDLEEQRSSVLEVLQQIGVPEDKLKSMIEVWNKVDLRENACEGDASATEGEVDETHCFLEAEDETQSNLSSEESIDEDDMVKGFSPEDTVDDQQNDNLEDWKRVDDQQCNYSEGWKTEDHQQGELSANSRMNADDSHSQSEDVKRVETSAIMGIGLQELLNVIDEKLSTEKVLTRTNFDRKWRPPRNTDTAQNLRRILGNSIIKVMSRRPGNPSRRFADSGSVPFTTSLHQKSRSSPLLSIGLVVVGALLLIGYSYSNSGASSGNRHDVSKLEGDLSCTLEVQRAIPILKKAYGENMRKVLHIGPETCSVVSKLLKEEDTEAWGVEPYDIEDADGNCKSLIRKGYVRVADIKFPLPYRAKSFNLVIVSDALDYLSPKYLNKTLPELARVAADGLVIFAGYPGKQRAKLAELSKFGRPAKLRSSSWWVRYFVQTGLEENESVIKKFEQAAVKKAYIPSCQIFHLNSYR